MSIIPNTTRVSRCDSVPIKTTYFTEEGYLRDSPIVTSVGIFEYHNDDGSVRRELRLPEEVFDPKSLATYEGKPIIVTHDAGEVDKNNVSREEIGTMLSPGYREGNNVRVRLIIHDTNELKRCGMRELSLGYNLSLDETPGIWNGEHYDAIQRNIEINHLAVVANARAGDQARLNIDSKDPNQKKKGAIPMAKRTRKDEGEPLTAEALAELLVSDPDALPAVADGEEEPAVPAESAENTEAEKSPEEAIQEVRDRKDRRDAEECPQNMDEANEVIRQLDEDISTLLDVIDTLAAENDIAATQENADEDEPCDQNTDEGEESDEEKPMNADSIDNIVRQRLEICRLGDKLRMDGLEKMSVSAAKKKIVSAVFPKLRLDGKSVTPKYIDAAFDIAKQSINAKKDCSYQRAQMQNGKRSDSAEEKTGADRARQKMIERQNGGNK